MLESRASALDARQAALVQRLQIHDLTISLNDLLGLPLNTALVLDTGTSPAPMSIPSREECIRLAQEHSPQIKLQNRPWRKQERACPQRKMLTSRISPA